jgi:hypothetical protein
VYPERTNRRQRVCAHFARLELSNTCLWALASGRRDSLIRLNGENSALFAYAIPNYWHVACYFIARKRCIFPCSLVQEAQNNKRTTT